MAIGLLLHTLSTQLLDKGLHLRTAESCTAGLIAATCTQQAGASAWFDGGWVTYSNTAKEELLHIDPVLIAMHGAVSEPVALAMASAARGHLLHRVSIAVTGIAGPSGGSAEKPVGTVWIAWAVRDTLIARQFHFTGNRGQVRLATVTAAITGLIEQLSV